jgi:hypothetical protein
MADSSPIYPRQVLKLATCAGHRQMGMQLAGGGGCLAELPAAHQCTTRAARLFLSPFPKDSLKYAPCGKISKNRPLSLCHSRRRQDITTWRQGHWRQDPAVVALTWQGAWRHRHWRFALAP